jgi:hypothetical protein
MTPRAVPDLVRIRRSSRVFWRLVRGASAIRRYGSAAELSDVGFAASARWLSVPKQQVGHSAGAGHGVEMEAVE